MPKRIATDKELEVFEMLDNLRESGITNMFGARPYIQTAFPELSLNEAREMLRLWMQNYNQAGDYSTINDELKTI